MSKMIDYYTGLPILEGTFSPPGEMAREIRLIAQDIIDSELSPEAMNEIKATVYSIARKHNVRMGTRPEGGTGIIRSNPEWTMLMDAYIQRLCEQVAVALMFDTPEDLRRY